ncbi:PTS galactitol transporter subunit IIA, partial [Salmonella enterica]|nr:PTS galactitol transporter subunit IIA [Salmonella enterica]
SAPDAELAIRFQETILEPEQCVQV